MNQQYMTDWEMSPTKNAQTAFFDESLNLVLAPLQAELGLVPGTIHINTGDVSSTNVNDISVQTLYDHLSDQTISFLHPQPVDPVDMDVFFFLRPENVEGFL
jgi:hypothetical protein